ncbi:MAG: NAD(P)(+) transhydrogenase (Re/Si-specific) subunit beta [Candidatus Zixiibacteriota bacterium]
MQGAIINISYVVAAALFIFGLKGLSHPRTAVRGNMLGALGMLVAIVVTLFDRHIISYDLILIGFVIGALIGLVLALRVEMTGMPQMVALLNGFGGAASALVAGAALIEATLPGMHPDLQMTIATGMSGLIGAVTFTGSLIAFGKLQGVITEKSVGFPGLQAFNAVLTLVSLALVVLIVRDPANHLYYWILTGVAGVLGITLTIPIGGADMPVVIALLNSYSGLAAAATGFVLNNNVLIIAGSLVGASGLILTNIMCVAMNRSLTNVLFGVMGPTGDTPSADDVYGGKVKSASAEEIAMLFDGAQRAIIVPGYGMAVSQAQHAVRDLTNLLESRGCTVEFAIHPVAGRMPGHMNVLLAEADIPYDKLKEMDEINPTFPEADVALVIGANDVVNPVARTDPNSPIAGMPILDVDKARTCVVVKRSLSPGFAGIPNPLFAADNTLMYFGDGKKAILDLINAIKES